MILIMSVTIVFNPKYVVLNSFNPLKLQLKDGVIPISINFWGKHKIFPLYRRVLYFLV